MDALPTSPSGTTPVAATPGEATDAWALPATVPATPPVRKEPGVSVLISEQDIHARLAELARRVEADHAGQELILVAVLKGAVMVVADLCRELRLPTGLEFMAVSSYGSATSSSGVVRILKDLDRDITGRHVLLVEDVVDSGLTLSWLVRHLNARNPASLDVLALLRKPEAKAGSAVVRYVGFDIGPEFVVGYGLDFDERFRGLPYVGLLDPDHVVSDPGRRA
ncbi:MAG TPA: hypoxanthine phosphoribosyltransferase [Mycobacteriales bacterium]